MAQNSTIDIGAKRVGPGNPCFFIAEVAQTHDGSLGLAHAFIDAVARTGADAIKFQTHYASEESTARDQWRVKFSRQDASRFDYWRRMEFTDEQWAGLAAHANEKNLIFLSSPFSVKAIDLLDRLGVPAWKIGSGEIENTVLLDRARHTKKPLLVSTGMSDWTEITTAYRESVEAGSAIALFHCTTEYPVAAERIGLNVIGEMLERFACPIGFSSHFPGIGPSIAAVALGARLVEHHVTMSPDLFGPDVSASITMDELATLVRQTRAVEAALASPVDKDAAAAAHGHLKTLFGRSIVASSDLPSGTELALEHLAFKKPGGGLKVREYRSLIGRRLSRSLTRDEPISMHDVERGVT